MSDFKLFKTAVARQFAEMQKHPLFRVDVDNQLLWHTYLSSFPPGTNPVFRQRTEYDCSCCRHFVRSIGAVVAVAADGKLVSLWDIEIEQPAYAAVAAALSALVKSRPLAGPFVHCENSAGTDRSLELNPAGIGKPFESAPEGVAPVRAWDHFFVNIDRRHVRRKGEIPTWVGEQRARHDVLLRSLREIKADAIETVLELIAQGSLYRGEEQRPAVTAFRDLKARFDALGDDPAAQDILAWTADAGGAVSRMRNAAIGTLLTDLSEGRELETAVLAFERLMAPANYKRPTALVTPAMVVKAKETLANLGLLSALERRFAVSRDVSAADVRFTDRSAKSFDGDVFDEVALEAGARAKRLDKVEEVPVERFLGEIVPRATALEVLFENRLAGNLVSLVAPVDPTAGRLFKWDNGFSWSYAGEMADAVRERVKRAGGNVTGDLCCRLAWSNRDDLDFHIVEPDGYEIFFRNKARVSPSGGELDVDMNVVGETREPVENIFYRRRSAMKEGEYRLFVQQYNLRETVDTGFEAEIDYLGEVRRYFYAPVVKGDVEVARFRYTHAGGVEILSSLPESQAGRTVWGLQTGSFHRVRLLTDSPNFWGGQEGVGNRHLFFMLEGCVNDDGSARGFFNEFLLPELEPHRKVFEVVGSRLKPAPAAEQLSGLGFSSTRRDSVVCRVTGSFTRTVKIAF